MTFNPDLSEKGKNLARKRRILPQKTVFWVLESLLSKSLQILSRLFLQEAKKTCSLQVETWIVLIKSVSIYLTNHERKLLTSCSTVLNSVSQCARVRMSNMSDKTWIGVPGEQNPFLAAWNAPSNWSNLEPQKPNLDSKLDNKSLTCWNIRRGAGGQQTSGQELSEDLPIYINSATL